MARPAKWPAWIDDVIASALSADKGPEQILRGLHDGSLEGAPRAVPIPRRTFFERLAKVRRLAQAPRQVIDGLGIFDLLALVEAGRGDEFDALCERARALVEEGKSIEQVARELGVKGSTCEWLLNRKGPVRRPS
jgi:hypothetical protein